MPYKPKEILRVLKRLGFIEIRQTGSHLHLRHPDGRRTIIPMHNKTVSKGLFQAILDDAILTLSVFRTML